MSNRDMWPQEDPKPTPNIREVLDTIVKDGSYQSMREFLILVSEEIHGESPIKKRIDKAEADINKLIIQARIEATENFYTADSDTFVWVGDTDYETYLKQLKKSL